MATEQTKETPATETQDRAAATPTVPWDGTNMQTSYANVCNVSSTREEMVLLFGINQAWQAGQQEVPVQLSNRIILSPHAAKRLSMILSGVVREHETRFGALGGDVTALKQAS